MSSEASAATTRGPEFEECELSIYDISPSGATATCLYCGTAYDISSSYDLDAIPPFGDGCEKCDPGEAS